TREKTIARSHERSAELQTSSGSLSFSYSPASDSEAEPKPLCLQIPYGFAGCRPQFQNAGVFDRPITPRRPSIAGEGAGIRGGFGPIPAFDDAQCHAQCCFQFFRCLARLH
ncbi:unnamed protein product, partial [Musa textilis]